jgi:hypothetical protein
MDLYNFVERQQEEKREELQLVWAKLLGECKKS